MNNNRWREVERIFDETLEQPEPDRAAFMAQACAGDDTLRQEVEALVAAHQQADGFLVASAAKLSPVSYGAAAMSAQQRLGPYQLLREIAQGGMGVVWLAARADDQYRQQVAIKLIKAGASNADIAHRLRHERQILAGLNHPNIARLLDGGTTDSGQPYLVMEYIEGVPIDEYCQQQNLSVTARLKLFRQVCAALQYAHQNLVIHRDLKPANILVTADGTVKLLDFGIAKLLQPNLTDSYNTQAGMHPMTPAYASPEQIRGESLTTASDVYSLGVVLYELLTGRSPYQLKEKTFGELSKAICEQEPTRPSAAVTRGEPSNDERPTSAIRNPNSVIRNLKGDLDSIVLMALRKEPQARYSSVEQFSADLQRYLDGLPTHARKGTFAYRAVKYVRRHKVPVAAAALIALSLLGGIGATSRQAQIARAEQVKAEAQRVRTEQALAIADEQRRRAEQALADVEAQRTRAENAWMTAEQRRRQADAARTEANQQRAAAETQRLAAEAERNVAQTQRQRAETQELSNRQLLYTSQMRLAQSAWDNMNIERVRELLTAHLPQPGQPDLRGFEWNYLWKLSHAELATLPHAASVQDVAFTPDGNNLISVDESLHKPRVLRMWDATTWQEKYQAIGDDSDIGNRIAIAKNAPYFVVGGYSMGFDLRDIVTGKRIKKIADSVYFLGMALSPDGTRVAGGLQDGSVAIYEVSTGREISRFHTNDKFVGAMDFSPDGQKLATIGRIDYSSKLWEAFSLKLWDVTTGKELWGILPKVSYWQALFLPDGQNLVCSTGEERVAVIDVKTGKETREIKLQERIYRISLSPDGKLLAVGQYDRYVTLWDTETWQMLPPIKGHSFAIGSLAFSPEGKTLATGSRDGTVKLWDINQSPSADTYQLKKSYVEEMGFAPTMGRLLIEDAEHSVHAFDTNTKQKLFTIESRAELFPEIWRGTQSKHTFAYTNDGSRIAVPHGQAIRIIDAVVGNELLKIPTPGLYSYAVNFSADGRMIAANLCACRAIDDFYHLIVWETATGRQLLNTGKPEIGFSRAVFLHDHQTLVTGGVTGHLVWWDLATGKQNKILSTGADGTSVTLAPDGKLLAVADKTAAVLLFDSTTGEKILTLKGHHKYVTRMAFSPDSKRLLTGATDQTARLWDLRTGQELLVFEKISEAGGVAFSADGKRIAISYGKGVVKEFLAGELEDSSGKN